MGRVSPRHETAEWPESPFFPRPIRQMRKLGKNLLLWRTGRFDLLHSCASGPAFHTSFTFCIGQFQPSVGSVGNPIPFLPSAILFSKSPDMHSPDLENSPSVQPPVLQSHRRNSHFSSSPTGTAVFVFPLFTHTRSHRRSRGAYLARQIATSSAATGLSVFVVPGIQRTAPVFHLHRNSQVHTIKGRKDSHFRPAVPVL